MRLCSLLLLLGLNAFAQSGNTEKYRSPLDIEIFPSGTFGELRGNHFHSGLDIRTQQKIGFPVYAPADGTVSRIKVSTFGYGKALYIDHPDGKTTVYGHLSAYNGPIAEYVRKRHYAEKNFEIEMYPRKGDLSVKKGDIIAFTGNSGGSGGPHLHYEFRDTKTQKIINPFLEGMDRFVSDTKSPVVNSLTVYAVGKDAVVNQSVIPQQLSYTTKNGDLYFSPIKAKGAIGFGIDTHDVSDRNYGKNGLYQLEASLNGKTTFKYTFDAFAFSESRYVNALIDFENYVNTKKRVQKLFYEKTYPLSVLSVDKNKGQINVQPGESFTYKIVLSDFHGNKTTLYVPIEYSKSEAKNSKNIGDERYFINSSKDYIFEQENITVEFPQNVFYDDFYLDMKVQNNVLELHRAIVPIHKNITITFDVSKIKDIDLEKAFISRIVGSKKEYFTTRKNGTTFSIKTRDFGTYQIEEDRRAPEVSQPSFTAGKWLSDSKEISFVVKDDLSGIDTIYGTINGKWALFDYDYKTNKIVHLFADGVVSSGKNEVSLTVKDRIGNSTIFTTHFFMK